MNHNSTIENPKVSPEEKLYEEKSHTYYWLADRDVGAVLLQDMADFRNHRHHGSIGALVIEDPATVPYSVAPDATTADISGITSGYSQTFHIVANQTPGDYMYRSGVLKYAVEQGLWGIMRVS